MLLIIGRRAGVFVRNTLRPSVLGLTECHSFLTRFPRIDASVPDRREAVQAQGDVTMWVRVKVESCDTDAKTFEASGERLTFGRNADCEVAVDPVAFPTVSGVHARVEPKAQGFVLVHLSLNNKTLLNDVPV